MISLTYFSGKHQLILCPGIAFVTISQTACRNEQESNLQACIHAFGIPFLWVREDLLFKERYNIPET